MSSMQAGSMRGKNLTLGFMGQDGTRSKGHPHLILLQEEAPGRYTIHEGHKQKAKCDAN